MELHKTVNRQIRKIMSKNKITPELLENRMKAKGFGEEMQNSESEVMKAVLKHYDIELTETWEDGLESYFYEESTNDGYSVFIATNNPNKISINDDVHYYDGDLSDALCEAIRYANSFSSIYIDDLEHNYVMEAMQTTYEVVYDQIETEVINELINEGYDE